MEWHSPVFYTLYTPASTNQVTVDPEMKHLEHEWKWEYKVWGMGVL